MNNSQQNNESKTRILKAMIETDWSTSGASYDWFIGTMIGTNDYLNESEKNLLQEQCNEIIMNFLNNLDGKRLTHMTNKARTLNPTFMDTFGKNHSYQYDENIIKGLKSDSFFEKS